MRLTLFKQVWELSSCKLQTDHIGHTGYINAVTISPDGSLCASGGKDGTTMLWDLNESKHLYSLNANDEIHALVFSPNRYWLCAATSSSIIIFDLEKKSKVDELKPEFQNIGKKSREPECVSLAWSADGQTLFAGYTDNIIRAWVSCPALRMRFNRGLNWLARGRCGREAWYRAVSVVSCP